MTDRHIVVEDLHKSFRVSERRAGTLGALAGLAHRRVRTVHALDGVSFSLDRGELVGYIGPNGAGKSTTVKILAGILVPDSGRCEVLGRVPWKHRIETVARLGVVFGQRTQLWWDLPVVESFDLLRDIYRVERTAYRTALDELTVLLDLEPLLDVPVRQLSLGQRMRCDLAASLLHAPALLYLDEPTIGLDAVSKLAVRDFVMRKNRENGTTVILTTHDMDDIETMCTRVILIHEGSILYDGTVEGLRSRVTSERELIIDLKDPVDVTDPAALAVSRDGLRVRIRFDPQATPAAALIARITARYEVTDLMVENPPIEQIVARLYRQLEAGARGAGAPAAGAEPGGKAVSVYGSYFAARFRTLLQYRGAAIGGMVTQVFFGLITVMVYEAFYRSSSVTQPMTLAQVRSYIWLGQAFLGMLPWNVEGEQRALVRSGAVAYELLRPVRLYSLWFARSVAWRTAPALMRCVPILALAFAFFGLGSPPTPGAAAAWAISMAGALFLSAAMTTLLTILLLWTVSGEGLNILFTALVIICSGMNIPLPLFPDWIRGVMEFLPYRGLVDSPYRLYVGYAQLADLPGLLLHQLGWTAAIVLGSILLMRRGLRRLSINGG